MGWVELIAAALVATLGGLVFWSMKRTDAEREIFRDHLVMVRGGAAAGRKQTVIELYESGLISKRVARSLLANRWIP